MRKFILMTFAGLVALSVRAGLSTESLELYWGAASKSVVGFTYVQLKYAVGGGDYISFDDGFRFADAIAVGKTSGQVVSPSSSTILADTDWSQYVFKVDAYDEKDNYLGSSDVYAYGTIAGSFFPPEMIIPEEQMAMVASTFLLNIPGPIPEPTSGLLLLLGVAGLALRRKTR